MKSSFKLTDFQETKHNNIKKTRAVLVFATERKNNVDPRPRAQKKVNYFQLFLPSNWCTSDVSNIYETYLQNKVNKGQEGSGKLWTLLKGLRQIRTKCNL